MSDRIETDRRQNVFARLPLVVAVAFISSGCGKLNMSINEMLPDSINTLEKAVGSEIVSSSQVEERTFNGYRVTTSVGYFLSGPEKTTANGYKVYQSVQGQALAEDRSANLH